MSKLQPPTISTLGNAAAPKKVQGVFDYQRAVGICKYYRILIFVETAVIRYHLSSDAFLDKVTRGEMEEVELDTIEIFEKVMPKLAEVQKLKEAIISEGYSTFEEAVTHLKFGEAEEFAVKIAMIPNIEKKVSILLRILKFFQKSGDFFMVSDF
jgi:hypothetical protein